MMRIERGWKDEPEMNDEAVQQKMISEIREIMKHTRGDTAREVNRKLLFAYWNIGRVIVEYEQERMNGPVMAKTL